MKDIREDLALQIKFIDWSSMAFNVLLLQFTRFWFNIILMIENVSFLTFFINSFKEWELLRQNAVLIILYFRLTCSSYPIGECRPCSGYLRSPRKKQVVNQIQNVLMCSDRIRGQTTRKSRTETQSRKCWLIFQLSWSKYSHYI